MCETHFPEVFCTFENFDQILWKKNVKFCLENLPLYSNIYLTEKNNVGSNLML